MEDWLMGWLILVVIVSFGVVGLFYVDIYVMAPEERSIVVINKTTEIVGYGFYTGTEYLIFGDDGIVYRTDDWGVYQSMKIGRKYNTSVVSGPHEKLHEKHWIERIIG